MVRKAALTPVSILAAVLAMYCVSGERCAGDERVDGLMPVEFFERRIRPVLVRHCYECHSGSSAAIKGGLRLDFRDGLLKGGDSGASITPGNPDESLLIQAVLHQGLEMPPGKTLSTEELSDLQLWVRSGAFDPRDKEPSILEVGAEAFEAVYQERMGWWSLQPLSNPTPETVRKTLHEEVDLLIDARLQQAGLQRSAPAAPRPLIRRLWFQLTGLPPDESELDPVLSASKLDRQLTSDDWQRVVDHALKSPHFGERWARHWMDVVRYTDTYGYEWDMPAKGSWRFRDYLIRGFNEDVPVNLLFQEQIAGDLLADPRVNLSLGINESAIGPMFYQMGEKRHGDSSEFNGIHQEMLDNKIDAFGKAFLATTLSCARCHDHKLDPISQQDYYALAGVFFSSRWVTNTIDLPERNEATRTQLLDRKAKLRSLLTEQWKNDAAALTVSKLDQLLAAAKPNTIEDLLTVWGDVRAGGQTPDGIRNSWMATALKHTQESERRATENKAHFSVVADFRDGIPNGWSVSGEGLSQITPRGEFVVAVNGPQIVETVLYGGLCTNVLSSKMNGALRSPWTRDLGPGHLSFEVAGGDFAARRVVVDNAFLTEKQTYVDSPTPKWSLVDGMGSVSDRHVYVEYATKTSNPNFPPRVGLGGACSEEQAADPRSWFQVSRVVRHVAPFSPFNELSASRQLLTEVSLETLEAVAERYRAVLSQAVAAWERNECTDDDICWLNWALRSGFLTNTTNTSVAPESPTDGDARATELKRMLDEYRGLETVLKVPETVNGMADVDSPFDYRLNVRGNYDELSEEVHRAPPRFLQESAGPTSDGASDFTRKQLAELVVSSQNPLTARVYVNRVWHWMFGQGLVTTTDDFGHAGELPSHPELLDRLALRFTENGWSTKYLIREILLSRTWQQSQEVSGAALEADPSNRLLHHYPVMRLDGESLRDAMLAVSGQLDNSVAGPVVYPHRLNEDPQKRLYSGPLDGNRRRSIYTQVSIMEPPRFLQTFNQPAPKIPTGRRDVTNTPAQSLSLMNDPFVLDQAGKWATRLMTEPDADPTARIQRMFQTAFFRRATDEECRRWTEAAMDLHTASSDATGNVLTNAEVWTVLCHTMFNTKEFLYLQ